MASAAVSLARNSAGIMGTTVVNAVLGYGYWTLAARLMPAAQVGLGSAAISALVIVSLVAHVGAGPGLIARLPQRTTREEWLQTVASTLAATALATLVIAAVGAIVLGFAVAPLRALAAPVSTAWFVLGAVGWTTSDLMDYAFIAERRSDLMLARNGLSGAFKVTALLVLRGGGADGLLASWALSGIYGTAVAVLLCHWYLRRIGPVRPAGMGAEAVRLARPVLGHHAISVGGLVPVYVLPMIVTARLGPRPNAYFAIAWMVGSGIFMISPAVSQALFAEGSHGSSGLRRLSLRSLLVTLGVIAVPAAVVALGGRLVLSLFGGSYAAGYPLLLLLVASAFPDAVSNVAVATLRVVGGLRRAAVLNAVIAAVTLAGAWFATPWLGILGAGLAWLAAQVIGALAVLVFRRELLP